ncbi:MAG: PAS domain-containing protein [Phycisphaerae bacterium]|nr:PAS domain-containing protein [Phycisphaerae bacterium]
MVRIADLLQNAALDEQPCDLVVSPDTPVREALSRMNELGCSRIGIDSDSFGFRAVLTREDLLTALMEELDKAQVAICDLQHQVEGRLAEQLDQIQASLRSIAETEKAKLDVAVMNLSEGLLILDKSGRVESANPAARTLLGLVPAALLDEITIALNRLGVSDLLVSGHPDSAEGSRLQVQSLHHRILDVRWTPIRDGWDRFEGFVVLLRDITDEIAADQAKTEFLSAISHELRTPLTGIRNSVSNMLAGVAGKISAKGMQYLSAMDADGRRLTGLVNDLLDLARLEADNLPICRRVVNLVSLISDSLSGLSVQAKSHKVRLGFQMVQYVSPVLVDPDRIRQVLTNLIDNALRFTPAFGSISVRCWEENNRVCFSVEDTGTGIPPEFQAVIYYKFSQLVRQAGPGTHGNGLGLALCKRILDIHGGSIQLNSQPGKGSQFIVSLPRMPADILVPKHLDYLVTQCHGRGDCLAVYAASFRMPNWEKAESVPKNEILQYLLAEVQSILTDPDDMAVKTTEDEILVVAHRSSDNHLHILRHKFEKIMANSVRFHWNSSDFVPMLGMSVYPADTCPVRELDSLARSRQAVVCQAVRRAKTR